MGNETETTNKIVEGAKAAGIGAIILAFITRLFTWKKSRVDRLQAEITLVQNTINGWIAQANEWQKRANEWQQRAEHWEAEAILWKEKVEPLELRVAELEGLLKENNIIK